MSQGPAEAVTAEYTSLLHEMQDEAVSYLDHHREMLDHFDINLGDNQLTLAPMFLSRQQLDSLEVGLRTIYEGLLLVYQHVFDQDPKRAVSFLETPRPLLPLLEASCSEPLEVDDLFGRADMFFWNDRAQLIEQNVTSGAGGMASIGAVVELFDDHPVMHQLRKQWRISRLSLVDSYASFLKSHCQDGAIGYLDAQDPETGELFDGQGRLFLEQLAKAGVNLSYLDDKRMTLGKEGLLAGGSRIRYVYRGTAALGLIYRLEELDQLLEACKSGQAEMIMSPLEIVLSDKRLLPYLSDDEVNGFLPDRLRSRMQSVLPWTRALTDRQTFRKGRRVRVPQHCLDHQAELVIKKGDGWGSQAVFIGCEETPEVWADRVDAGVAAGDWIVQELVTPAAEKLPFLEGNALVSRSALSMTCPFLVRGRIAGIGVRTSLSGGSRIMVGGGVKGSRVGIRTAFCIEGTQ